MRVRFLADESCDFAVVRALRTAGFDVLSVSESTPRAEDSEVIDHYPSLQVKDIRAAVAYSRACPGKCLENHRLMKIKLDENISRHLKLVIIQKGHECVTAEFFKKLCF